MPDAYNPDYEKWLKQIENYGITKDTTLIGHSCGGGFFIRWLSEQKAKIRKLILVAPWIDPTRFKTSTFFDFTIDSLMHKRIQEIHILSAENEHVEGVKESVEIIKNALPLAQLHFMKGMGHFTYKDMNRYDFPELLKIVVS